MATQDERLQRLISAIFNVHQYEEEMDCERCSQQFDCLVELVMRGTDLRQLLPAVEEHLRCCPDCNEEFEALIAIISAETSNSLETPPDQRPASD